jgi:hypothetical protein
MLIFIHICEAMFTALTVSLVYKQLTLINPKCILKKEEETLRKKEFKLICH